jgi:uncharacterized protein
MKIGVLADTHIPDLAPRILPRVCEALSGVDIILHAGDISRIEVLQELEPIAQTYAVAGNQESAEVRKFLQESQRLEFANRSIGLIHGHRAWSADLMNRGRYLLDARARQEALYKYLMSKFTNVDAIVFGHTHQPYIKMHGGVLLFNPGSATPAHGQPATIGILEIGPYTIKGRIVAL